MKTIYLLLAAAASGGASWAVRSKLADKRETQLTVHHRKAMENRWFYAFDRGWESAKDHYTRYYTADQHQFVFGEVPDHMQ